MAMSSEKMIAGSRYQFHACCRRERRRVRSAKRLNHCLCGRVSVGERELGKGKGELT